MNLWESALRPPRTRLPHDNRPLAVGGAGRPRLLPRGVAMSRAILSYPYLWPHRRKPALVATIIAMTVLLLAGYLVTTVRPAQAASVLLSQGKPATASSVENAGTVAANAVDGNAGTRWSSQFSDPQW